MPKNDLVPIEMLLPNKLPIIPLNGRPIFPGIFTPIMLSSKEDIETVEEANHTGGIIGLVLVKDDADNPKSTDLHQVGTVAKIVKSINLPDGAINIFISTIKRFKIKKFISKEQPFLTVVEYPDEIFEDSDETKALTRALLSEMKVVSENNPLFSEEMRLNMANIDNSGKIADFIASILNIEKNEQQALLGIFDVKERMTRVLVSIKREQELLRIQKKIQNEINEKVDKSQREYFLREEMKAIKKELGVPGNGIDSDSQKYEKKIAEFKFEGEVKEIVEQELEKFSTMEYSSSEYIVTKNWLDLVCSLPWNATTNSSFDLYKAREILESDHYGLNDVKDRIVEYLAVRKLKKNSKGSILCLVGPPGVGKTSIGKSVARALGKSFFRFSVGGMRDEAEIKGHRRTYVGALPGKIIQGLKITKCKDPVFMIDEIDKMGQSYQGDPSSALLEVLDPEQNNAFRDNYLDLPFDVSDIFFIITANTLDSIPIPLRDRMEIISLSGYVDSEKLEIAKNYLIPKSLEKAGLKKNRVKYTRDALTAIAEGYAREAGVRGFEKCLDKIHRKIAFQVVSDEESLQAKENAPENKKLKSKKAEAQENVNKVSAKEQKKYAIDKPSLEKYLGKPLFDFDDIKRATEPGMTIGLAWTSMGGDTLIIEAASYPGKGELKLTGQLGDVMKESASIAYSWVRKHAVEVYKLDNKLFEEKLVHLHVPEGATPKDGPSAGVTMATALMSLFLNKRVKDKLAMTGELSLTGQVMPIGGLREKTVAAKRNKIKEIIIPKANERDLDDIPDVVKKGINFYPVERMEEVLKIALS